MRTLALLASLTIVAMAFAGCSDGGGDGDSSTTSSSASGTASATGSSTSRSGTATSSGSATSTSTGSSVENSAPSGSISVTVNGTNATFALTGSDPDGDTIVWDLAFGDGEAANGTSLPANVTHAYAAGNYTANFTITDGTDSATYDVSVGVSGASGFQQVVYQADVTMFCTHCSVVVFNTGDFVPSASLASGEQGFDAIWLEITPEMIGLPFTITSTGGDPDAVAMDACSPEGGQIESYGEGPEAGIIPAGTTCLVTWEYETPMSTITMTVG